MCCGRYWFVTQRRYFILLAALQHLFQNKLQYDTTRSIIVNNPTSKGSDRMKRNLRGTGTESGFQFLNDVGCY